ncbi:XRE family transcriptional regulator [Catellatospora sp. TT07R-123]|uniref:helix-turn-helix domain-containing protein n=1 Tax=Catellatospora sp. TT07R-123 TaxID=2733863 RepID=UPI001B01F619|nr:helix-turn-helix domain-containing protein [Catellatospora sp. TT07R-123]GHJ43956.1 XRE family transcriptional regulator [Catellatospora sp. TT07R-123]
MDETFGQVLARMRAASGLSVRSLGAAAKVDPGFISKISNHNATVSQSVAQALDVALRAGGELMLAWQAEDARRRMAEVTSDAMRRRTLMAGTTGLILGGLLPGRAEAGHRLGLADVTQIQRHIDRLIAMDYQFGGEGLWQAAVGYAREAYWWLDNGIFTDEVEAALLRVTSRVQMCAGWLSFDSGQHDVSRNSFNEALGLAQQADDAEAETHALANLAYLSNYLGSPKQARRWADAAGRAAAPTGEHARLPVLPLLRVAMSSALTADKSAFEKAMTSARRHLNRDVDQPVAEWRAFVTWHELDGVEGTCAMELGETERAIRLLHQAIEAHPDGFARNRATYKVRLARANLDAENVEEAVSAADSALDDVSSNVTSWRLGAELGTVAQRMAAYHDMPAVERFLTRYKALV